jgi:hypothetical protein
MRHFWIVVLGVVGCGGGGPSASSQYVTGFNPSAPPAGYQRYVTSPLHQVQPGQDIVLCEWVAGPRDTDVDVADVAGAQSRGGHHVVLYASENVDEPIGKSRECTPKDSEGVQFMGAIGGEGSSKVSLPAGMVFRLPKGHSLMANVHYINATPQPFDAQSVLDVRVTPVNPDDRTAAMLVMNQARFKVPPLQAYTSDGYCTMTKDVSLIMFTDHTHEHGTSIFNEVIRADGSRQMLANDDTWNRDLIFNPNWTRWDVAAPMVIKAGDRLHVRCAWQNTLDKTLGYPDEMCVGLGFFLEGGDQVVCNSAS